MEAKKYKIVIADDEELFATLLAKSLDNQDGICVYSMIHDLKGLKSIVKDTFFDLLILYVDFNGQSSIEFLKDYDLTNKPFKTLCLTSHDNTFIEQEAYALGVDSFLNKSVDLTVLIKVIKQVLNSNFSNEFEKRTKFEVEDEVFTKRQIQVMQALVDFDSEMKVANVLNISVSALKSHKQNLFVKTNTKNEKMLLKYAFKHKLVFHKKD